MMLKSRWQEIETKGYPPRDTDDYYGDRYSISVLIGNSKTGQVAEKAYLWDYDMLGWVEFDLCEGADPEDYEIQYVDHWAHWPKCKLVCLD